jgi:hypothetical protein
VLQTFAHMQINGKEVTIEAAGEERPRPSRPAPPLRGKSPSRGHAASGRKGPESRRPPEIDKARRKIYKKSWGK